MSEIPELKAIIRKENIATFIINSIGAFSTFFYLNVIDPTPVAESTTSEVNPLNLFIFVFVGILTFGVGLRLGRKVEKGVSKWYMLIKSGKKTPADLPMNIKRDILNYPLYSSMITAMMWVLVGVIFALFNESLRILVGIVSSGGLVATTMLYFIGDLFWRPMIPFFFPEGGLSAVHAFRLPVLGKLLIVFLFIGILPPALLVSLSLQRAELLLTASNPVAVLANLRILQIFILSIIFIISIGLAFFTTRSITNPIDDLRKAMGQVQKNNLDARVFVTTNDELGYLGEHFNQMTAGLRQKEMLRNLLNIYISPEVAQEALTHGTKLGGELIECSVLFSDIRGFTTISETLQPDDLMSLLNRYMSMMVEVIVQNGGMVNKFGGDSLLAIFGTPLNPSENHAEQAVRSAQAMLHALERFNQDEENSPHLQIGIGIATGTAVAGNIGGRERIEYTVIGDTVNLASRLEEKTKIIEGLILISEKTYQQASKTFDFQARHLPNITVKGKQDAFGVYAMDI